MLHNLYPMQYPYLQPEEVNRLVRAIKSVKNEAIRADLLEYIDEFLQDKGINVDFDDIE